MSDQPHSSPEPEPEPRGGPEPAAPAEPDTEEHAAVQAPPSGPYGPADDDPNYDDFDDDELPPRPRRRLLAPLPVALLAVLMAACGFIVGVLVEKGQSSSGTGTSASSLAARFAGLRSGASGSTGAAGGFAGRAAGLFGAGATADGEVSFIEGNTLYVLTAEGNTVKVDAAPGAAVTKTVKAKVRAIHPGETVVATGTTGANGAIDAESIRVGSAASSASPPLFGGG